ncbi:MAG TPA: hypothetical protein VK034_13560 [Enhygromyxa sp.]|nr:hypothetical protein [Enhygromyxa sp.]
MNRYSLDRITIPNASLKVLARLGKTLLRDQPEQTNVVIEEAADKLKDCIAEVDVALTERVRETNPELVAGEVDFDRATDTQWIWLRKLLEGWAASFGHPGLNGLSKERQAKADLPALRRRAERARKLHERLFGAEGTNWAQRAYIEQVESMAALLRLIQEDELGDELAEIVGPELPRLLAVCQSQYEVMVSERMSRTASLTDNFRELRAKLRWKLDRYKNAIETLRDDDDPASYERVDHALRSLLLLNQRINKSAETDDDELLGQGLVELEAPVEAEPPTPEG